MPDLHKMQKIPPRPLRFHLKIEIDAADEVKLAALIRQLSSRYSETCKLTPDTPPFSMVGTEGRIMAVSTVDPPPPPPAKP